VTIEWWRHHLLADTMTAEPRLDDLERIERALGWRPTWFGPATAHRGDSETAARWIVADDHLPVARRRWPS
jgi:hypothetical protein